MSEYNQISLPNYILRSIFAAWKVIQINPKAMDYFDLSSDGFWKSFWAIALMLPVFVLSHIYSSHSKVPQPIITDVIFFFINLPLSALVMYYFTRYMNINTHYVSMVIANNWVSAVVFNILVIVGLILNLVAPSYIMTPVVMMVISIYLSIFASWFMFKISLKISGYLAIGVLLFDILFGQSVRVLLLKFLNPEVFSSMYSSANTLLS